MSDFPEKENLNQDADEILEEAEELSTVFADPTEHKKTAVKEKKKLLPALIASVLAVAILAGGTVAVIKLIPERDDDTSSSLSIETIKVLELDTNDFKTVTVTNENGTFKFYSKEEDSSSSSSDTSSSEPTVNWYIDGYKESLISTSSVSSVVSSAASLEATMEITEKSVSECGLDNPKVKVEVATNDGKQFALLVGNTSPDNTGTYVKLSNEDKIYLTGDDLVTSFTFDALTFAAADSIPAVTTTDDMKDYTDDDGGLTSFERLTLSGTKYPEKIVLEQNTDKALSDYAAFMTTSPTKRIAENVDGIFGYFKSGVTTAGAYSYDTGAAARKKFGLDKADIIAEMKIKSFKQTHYFKLQEDGNYAVWFEGADFIYKVAASSLTFVNYEVVDYYATWVVLQSINDLSNFTIKTPEKTYSFDIKYDDSEDAEETYIITHNGKKLVAENFQNFYQEFVSLACSDYTVGKTEGEPAMTVILSYTEEGRKASTVEFRKASETKYQYRIDGIDMGKINSSSLNKILRYVEKVSLGETINS